MIIPFFAHIETFSIPAHHIQNLRRHQAIVKHHIGMLHQAQGTKSKQIRITRAGTDEVDRPLPEIHTILFQLLADQGNGLLLTARKHHLRYRSLEYLLPKPAPLSGLAETGFDLVAKPSHKRGKTTIGSGDHRFQMGAQHTRQYRRTPTAGYGHHDRITIHNGREDETT